MTPERFTPPKNGKILFIDMNSFFASCEQADEPSLCGKPVIVVPTQGSCALSASYEAKAYGICTGTLEREARLRVPNLVVRQARPKRYMEYHHKLSAILQNLTPAVTMRSVDEASIRLCRNEDPWYLAHELKRSIWRELGPMVHCSIGLAPNIFLAKLGTELQKPDGLVEIKTEDLLEVYTKVSLRDLWGINYGMERRLNHLGIYTPVDFYHCDPSKLQQFLGVIGWRWWLRLHGYEVDEASSVRRTISHSHVLPPAYRLPRYAYVTALRLITKVARRLRKEGYMTTHISLIVLFADRSYELRHLIITPAADTVTLSRHIRNLWRAINPTKPILKLAIWTSHLVPASGVPAPLFPEERKRYYLAKAIDTINDRHGTDTIHFATLDTAGSKAPDRISFTALFDIEHE